MENIVAFSLRLCAARCFVYKQFVFVFIYRNSRYSEIPVLYSQYSGRYKNSQCSGRRLARHDATDGIFSGLIKLLLLFSVYKDAIYVLRQEIIG